MNPLDDRLPVDLLDRYLAGAATPEEHDRIRAWLAADPARSLHSLTAATFSSAPSNAARLALARVLGRMQADARPSVVRAAMSRRTVTARTTWWRTGMSGALLAAVSAAVVTLAMLTWPHISKTPTIRNYAAPRGEQALVTLADGTRIRLAPASQLHVVLGATRDITLHGEALFFVAHAPTPFVVRTTNAETRVLGTTFLVRQYAAEQTGVVVADGRVTLRSTAATMPGVVLSKDMRGVVDDSGRVTVLSGIALDDYTALMSGRLVFRKTPMRSVIAELDRAYAIDIQVADSALLNEQLTLTVPVERRSLEQVMRVLTLALDAHYTRSGSVVTIAPGRRTSQQLRTPLIEEHQYGR